MNKYILIIISENGEVFSRAIFANKIEILEGGQIAFYNQDGYVAIAPNNSLIYLDK